MYQRENALHSEWHSGGIAGSFARVLEHEPRGIAPGRRLRALLTSQRWTPVDARYRTVFGLSRVLPKCSGSALCAGADFLMLPLRSQICAAVLCPVGLASGTRELIRCGGRMSGDGGYTLRLNDSELVRYRAMARKARQHEEAAWKLAGIVPGARVADIGCGPGILLAELAREVGPQGTVIGVDNAAEAVAAAASLIEVEGLVNASVREGRADDTGLASGTFDVVMQRHVLIHNGGRETRSCPISRPFWTKTALCISSRRISKRDMSKTSSPTSKTSCSDTSPSCGASATT